MTTYLAAVLRILVSTVATLALTTTHAAAQAPSVDGSIDLRLAALRATRHIARVQGATVRPHTQTASQPKRFWVKRHPVLFGEIVRAVAGVGVVSATVDAEASFVRFYGGGAAGAMVGWVVSR